MVDTSHQRKVLFFLGTFQVELYNRLENWGCWGKGGRRKKCGAESRTWTVKTGLRFRLPVHTGWSNSLRNRGMWRVFSMFLSVPEPVFPKSRANWIYLESKSHPGLSVLRLEAGQDRVDAASLPSVCPAWEPGLPVVRTLGSVKQDPVKVQPKDF